MKFFLKRPWVQRFGLTAVILIIFVFLPAFTLAPTAPDWVPEPLQNWAFDSRLLIGRPITTLSSLVQAVKGETAVSFHTFGKKIQFESDGLIITGTLYGTESAGAKPAILLLHGSTPQGRKLGLYRLMGQELAALGYVVLTIDQRGFGQSDNPPDVDDVESFNFVGDVKNGLEFLASLPSVDHEQIFLIGHSFGGDVALTAVAANAPVEKLIIIGPGRRFTERGGTLDAPEFNYFKRRQMRYMFLWQAIPDSVFLDYRTRLPMENHLDYFDQPDHTPILIMDGELESMADQAFLAQIYEDMAGEKAYTTLDDADHYANVANVGPLIVYDETAVSQLVDEIDTYLKE